MDRLRALRTFIAVAEHASFAEAARRLTLSPTTVTRIIAGLEEALGAPLLVRTTRTVRLTQDGAVFLERCRTALSEIDDAFETVRGGGAKPHGTLTVTAPVMFGRLHVLPLVLDLLQTHPDLQIRLLLLDRVTNLVDEGIDVAVRIGRPPASALQMLKIGEVRRVFSASPAYLDNHSRPARLADLRHHALIGIEDELGSRGQANVGKGTGSRAVTPQLSVNSIDAAIWAAEAGLGIVGTLSYQVAGQLADGRLVRVLPDDVGPPIPISLLFQNGRRDTPNIRAFLTAARSRMQHPATNIPE